MSETIPINFEGVEHLPLEQFARSAYLNYAMYVIMDRALPHIGDGLKPVQRRIVYAMSELGLRGSAKYKKSARTVGDVLGKYHPHGDSACYEAMVLMAQPFSYRYPLIDGQGNWGAPDDPKSFAAMRYTEARLSGYSQVLLEELGMGTVDWTPNFDGTLQEPLLLPSRLPNVMLNGATGIAVGMATDIPPHNIGEVVTACIHLIDHPRSTVDELCALIQGPDYPTGAEIVTARDDIIAIYRTGRGVLRVRATYEFENGDIAINALPPHVSPAKVLEQIAAQMTAKKLPMVADLRDESDHDDPIRLIVIPRSNRVDKEALMAHLFATTDLERSCRVNMNLIGLNRKPQVMNLAQLLGEWITFRKQTVKKRLRFRLDKVLERLHILDGLLIAYLNIDEVIRIIRSEEKPKPVLMQRFALTDTQAEAVLQLRLRHLARIEEVKIRGEQSALDAERRGLEKVLDSESRLKTLIKKELRADARAHGDGRRTPIVARKEARAISEADLAPVEPVTVIMSANGWVRAAKGHEVDPETVAYKAGDGYQDFARGRSNQQAVFLDSSGRTYTLPAHTLASARGHGEPLTGRLTPPPGALFLAVMMALPYQDVLMASDAGYGFVTRFSNLYTKNQKGKVVLTLPKNALPLPPLMVNRLETDLLAAVTNEGRMLVFPLTDLPVLPKGKGNKIIAIPPKRAREKLEWVTHLVLVPDGGALIVYAGKRHFRLTWGNLTAYRGERGRRGKKLPRGLQKVDRLSAEAPARSPRPES